MLRLQEDEREEKHGSSLLSEVKAIEEDSWMLYLYAIKSPATKEKYLMRLERFLNFIDLQEVYKNDMLEDKARVFAKRGRNDKAWAFNNVIKFIQIQKDRFNQKEITAGTIRNYVKSIKLFCRWLMFLFRGKRSPEDSLGLKGMPMTELHLLKRSRGFASIQTGG